MSVYSEGERERRKKTRTFRNNISVQTQNEKRKKYQDGTRERQRTSDESVKETEGKIISILLFLFFFSSGGNIHTSTAKRIQQNTRISPSWLTCGYRLADEFSSFIPGMYDLSFSFSLSAFVLPVKTRRDIELRKKERAARGITKVSSEEEKRREQKFNSSSWSIEIGTSVQKFPFSLFSSLQDTSRRKTHCYPPLDNQKQTKTNDEEKKKNNDHCKG